MRTLNYDRGESSVRWTRWTLIVLAVVVAGFATRQGHKTFWDWWHERQERKRVLAIQSACMNFMFPPNLPVYTEEFAWQPGSYSKVHSHAAEGTHYPKGLENLLGRADNVSSVGDCAALVLLHSRETPDGREFLLALGVEERLVDVQDTFMSGAAFAPTSSSSPPKPVRTYQFLPMLSRRRVPVRVSAAQPDPNNRNHFTIPYQAGDESGLVDGYLQNDLSIRLQCRVSAPASQGSLSRD